MKNKSTLLFELSGEHPELPLAELESILPRSFRDFDAENVTGNSQLVKFETTECSGEVIAELAQRLAMTKSIYERLVGWPTHNIAKTGVLNGIQNIQIEPDSSFKLIMRRAGKNQTLTEETIKNIKAEIIGKLSETNRVNVKSPDVELTLFLGSEIILAKRLLDIDRRAFEHRKPQNRPYFAPISLHPRLARCLVNLTGIGNNALVLDPFCGTGGILLEAGLMGLRVAGVDIDERMVKGAKMNLEHCGLTDHTLIHSNVKDLPEKLGGLSSERSSMQVQAIVTEPPYGRATTTRGEPLESLLGEAYQVFYQLLPMGGRLVISLPDMRLATIAEEYFNTLKTFNLKIHKSLTKYIFVFERKKRR